MRERLALSRPTRGACGFTGTWREFRPVVDQEKCNQCGICQIHCPDAVIDEELNIDLDFCKGCGVCANVCPKKAIAMVREEK
ncbi:MAG: pyruvate ferredoxin oxidoreductase delta subunit [Methanofollis sp.]|nr:pyruvate ferredoxin oxidoreductase delta subunit [Methanofollis sp.]